MILYGPARTGLPGASCATSTFRSAVLGRGDVVDYTPWLAVRASSGGLRSRCRPREPWPGRAQAGRIHIPAELALAFAGRARQTPAFQTRASLSTRVEA